MGEYYNDSRTALENIEDLPVGRLATRQVILDNEKSRVTYFEFTQGDHTGWHKHEYLYGALYLTNAKLFHTRIDGTQFLSEHQAQEFKVHPIGIEHNVISESEHVIKMLEIEFKI